MHTLDTKEVLLQWFQLTHTPMLLLQGNQIIDLNPAAQDRLPDLETQTSIKSHFMGLKLTGESLQRVDDLYGNKWQVEIQHIPNSTHFICSLTRSHADAQHQDQLKQYRELHEVGLSFLRCREANEFHRIVVESGIKRLGFDRLALFLMSDDGQRFFGTWGTDDDGRLSDEHEFSAPMPDSPWVVEALQQEEHITVWEDFPLRYYGREIGRGWNAMVPLWYDNRPIGWIAIDNLIRRLPFNAGNRQLLLMYGQLVSTHIMNRSSLYVDVNKK